MAQADQAVQNATFPTVRADINNNLAALFTDSSGATAPTVTVAFQDWIDTSGADAVWKKRNAANNAWITLGTISASTIAFEGTLPSQSGNSGKYLGTNGTVASWLAIAVGATLQTFASSATYTPTASKTSFLVILTGGGGGAAGTSSSLSVGSGGAAGTVLRLYNTTELGSNASIVIGAGGGGGGASSNGGSGGTSSFTCSGSGSAMSATGGGGGVFFTAEPGVAGGGSGSFTLSLAGQRGNGSARCHGGASFWGGGPGAGGHIASVANTAGAAGAAGICFVLEW